ncbi:hypothetical protein Pcinc_010083 [Petrolisthes cinctipes]|uniref:Uncharacterized protein n=1 Tax=Petrolisthes cinctipes TaxID=88211 RepID=A0AAE1G5I9_PETCI|nr:hypothetical protein Pcinc_010083 [Petrolisthes cinctipes]
MYCVPDPPPHPPTQRHGDTDPAILCNSITQQTSLTHHHNKITQQTSLTHHHNTTTRKPSKRPSLTTTTPPQDNSANVPHSPPQHAYSKQTQRGPKTTDGRPPPTSPPLSAAPWWTLPLLPPLEADVTNGGGEEGEVSILAFINPWKL